MRNISHEESLLRNIFEAFIPYSVMTWCSDRILTKEVLIVIMLQECISFYNVVA